MSIQPLGCINSQVAKGSKVHGPPVLPPFLPVLPQPSLCLLHAQPWSPLAPALLLLESQALSLQGSVHILVGLLSEWRPALCGL